MMGLDNIMEIWDYQEFLDHYLVYFYVCFFFLLET